jgi:hypothetical protein
MCGLGSAVGLAGVSLALVIAAGVDYFLQCHCQAWCLLLVS